MEMKTPTQNKTELTIIVIALLAFFTGLVGHLAGTSFANSDAFGIIAAPVPLVLGIVVFIAYKVAEKGSK